MRMLGIRKYSLFAVSCIAALLLAGSSCKIDDTDFHDLINSQDVEVLDIQLDTTALEEAAEVIPTDPTDSTYDDYIENQEFTRVVNIAYNGDTAVATGDMSKASVVINGAHVIVSVTGKKVKICLSGATTKGSLKIYGDNKCALTLNGVSITNPNGAAINNQCGKRLYVTVADSTTNTLTDGDTYTETVGEDLKGCFFSEGKVLMNGGGTLKINAMGKNGLATDDYVRVRRGVHLSIFCSTKNGIKANDGIFINGGVINISTSANGSRGISCETPILISGGRTTIITNGSSLIEEGDTSSCAAVKCDTTVTVSGGYLNCKSTGEGGKCINAYQFKMTGGDVNLVSHGTSELSSPKAFKVDTFTMTAGNFYAYSVNDKAMDVNILDVATNYVTQKKAKHYFIVQY